MLNVYLSLPSPWSLLALHLSGTPSLKTGTSPTSCLLLDNHLYMSPLGQTSHEDCTTKTNVPLILLHKMQYCIL